MSDVHCQLPMEHEVRKGDKRMKRLALVFGMVFLVGAFLVACGGTGEEVSELQKPPFIEVEDMDAEGGADLAGAGGDNLNSRFYKHNDYYNMVDDETLTIIEKYRPILQTTEWTCGNSMAVGVLNHYGITKYDEQTCAAMATSNDETGTTLDGLVEFFKGVPEVKIVEAAPYGTQDKTKAPFSSSSLYAGENSDDTEAWVDDAADSYFIQWLVGHIQGNRPIMVNWVDWGGHWQAIIGYDNNGTPVISDDVLIMADPYDTTDQWEDGYYVVPLERFFYMWREGFEPYQPQVYLIVEPV